jgi:transposase-like protein
MTDPVTGKYTTTEVAQQLGIKRKQLTKFLRRMERALGIRPTQGSAPFHRQFTDVQVDNLRMAYYQSRRTR